METARPPVDGGTVLITGASSGIGRELAVQLAARASALVLVARRADRLNELRASLLARHPQLQLAAVAADLSDPGEVERVVTQVRELAGPVDILVNNAGVGDQGLFDRADWDRTRHVLHTNVLAVTQLTAALVPSMVKRGCGVLSLGSGAGQPRTASRCRQTPAPSAATSTSAPTPSSCAHLARPAPQR